MIEISACVIVKNEEKNIQRWLECMKQLADEIIVVDTGSTDATIALVQRAGAEPYYFSWCDDFSAAKNYALEQAHGNWIVFLDADEFFQPDMIPRVREYIRRYRMDYRVVGLYCRRLEFNQGKFFGEFGQLRVFRNLRSMRYKGRIHEALDIPAGKRIQYAADLEIYHTGYSQELLKSKIMRDLHILQEEEQSAGRELPEQYIYRMDAYYGLEDYARAEMYARKAIASEVRYLGMEGREYATLAGILTKQGRPHAEIEAVLDAGIAEYPFLPGLIMMKGLLHWDSQDYIAAQKYLQQGIQLREHPSEQQMQVYSDNTVSILPYAYLYMGRIAEMQGETEQALELFVKACRQKPQDGMIFDRLYQSIAGWQPAAQIELLNCLYDKQQAAAFLANRLRSHRAGSVFLYYARLAGEDLSLSISGYMAGQRYDAVAARLTTVLDSLYRIGIAGVQLQEGKPEGAMQLWPKRFLQVLEEPEAERGAAVPVRRMRTAFAAGDFGRIGEKVHG